jgi:hypothetical protein
LRGQRKTRTPSFSGVFLAIRKTEDRVFGAVPVLLP